MIKISRVGRPNVGKSSIFNRFSGKKTALISKIAGMTSDVRESIVDINNIKVMIYDMAGIVPDIKNSLLKRTNTEIIKTINFSDLLLMVYDLSEGINSLDFDISKSLLKSGKEIILIGNKSDSKFSKENMLDGWSLGLGEPTPVSAEHGNGLAQSNLGLMYDLGNVVEQNHNEAFRLFKLSAEQGIKEGQSNLGRIYEKGLGVRQDYTEAVKWYRLAAIQGDVTSQFYLGTMYLSGRGVIKDYVIAHMWFNLANSNGQKDALKNRNIVERRMTASQIDKAQQLAKNWKPNNRISVAESPPIIVPKPSIPQPPKSKDGVIATGTGFLFGSQDYIITNYHVVKGTSQIKVKFLNEEIFDAQVIAKDIKNDVAILKLNKTPSFQTREMKFGDSSMVRMGDKVFTIGYPSIQILGTKPKYSEGVISAVTGIQDNPTMFQTTVPILPGSSGSPLFNENGEVIGLTTGSLSSLASELLDSVPHNINYAVKSSFVKNTISTVPEALLSNRGIVVVPKESNSRSDFIEAIKKNVVLIVGPVD